MAGGAGPAAHAGGWVLGVECVHVAGCTCAWVECCYFPVAFAIMNVLACFACTHGGVLASPRQPTHSLPLDLTYPPVSVPGAVHMTGGMHRAPKAPAVTAGKIQNAGKGAGVDAELRAEMEAMGIEAATSGAPRRPDYKFKNKQARSKGTRGKVSVSLREGE